MLAWIRTGIALMAFGFAIARFGLFLQQMAVASGHAPPRASIGSAPMGIALVALGVLINALATLRYGTVRRAIDRGSLGAPSAALVYTMGGLAVVIGIAMTILLARSVSE
jgi:putative membrane protein